MYNKLKLLCFFTTTLALPEYCLAFGAKQPQQNPSPVTIRQATPTRFVVLSRITPPTFYFPNGNRIDMSVDLNQIVDSQINQSLHVRTATQSNLIISGGITSLEMNILELGITVGWNENGILPIPNQPGASGEVHFQLSSLSMDFKIFDQATGETYVADYTDESLSNLNFTVSVDISLIHGGFDLLYQTKLSDSIRTAVGDIIAKMENKSDFNLLPWASQVTYIDNNKQTIEIGAGSVAGIQANDLYSIYTACSNVEPSPNCLQRFIADVHVVSVGPYSATAEIYNNSGSITAIQLGDNVFVKPLTQINQSTATVDSNATSTSTNNMNNWNNINY